MISEIEFEKIKKNTSEEIEKKKEERARHTKAVLEETKILINKCLNIIGAVK